jgi:hypothetical protein
MNIDLDAVNVEIRFVFNTRTESWYIRLKTNNAELNDVKLVKNFPLISQYKAHFFELPGDFLVLKISDEITDPELNYDNLGEFWALFYLSATEVAEWREENGI